MRETEPAATLVYSGKEVKCHEKVETERERFPCVYTGEGRIYDTAAEWISLFRSVCARLRCSVMDSKTIKQSARAGKMRAARVWRRD